MPPWSAEPTTGLVNLQAVTITAHDLPNGNYIVGQCPSDVGVPDLNRCVTTGRPNYITVIDGNLRSTVHVYRQLHDFDCASAPGACAVGFVDGRPDSDFAPVGFPISFDPERPPRITVSPSDNLREGQSVVVRGVDVGRGAVEVAECAGDRPGCSYHRVQSGADGSFEVSFPVERTFVWGGHGSGSWSCDVEAACVILVSVARDGLGGTAWDNFAAPVVLHFAPVPETVTTTAAPSPTMPTAEQPSTTIVGRDSRRGVSRARGS